MVLARGHVGAADVRDYRVEVMAGQPFADILGSRTERFEVAQVLQFRVVALQFSDALLGLVVDDRHHQRGVVVVLSILVPGARGVIHQPDAERIEMGHQDVRLRAVGVKWKLLQHESRTDLIDVEKVHSRLIPALRLLDPQQETEVGVDDSGETTQLAGCCPGNSRQVATIWVLTASSSVTASTRRARCAPAACSVFSRCASPTITGTPRLRHSSIPGLSGVQLDYHRANPRLPKVAKEHDANVCAEAADHDMSTHPRDLELLHPIAKQQPEGTDRGPAGHGRSEITSDLQLPREPPKVRCSLARSLSGLCRRRR